MQYKAWRMAAVARYRTSEYQQSCKRIQMSPPGGRGGTLAIES